MELRPLVPTDIQRLPVSVAVRPSSRVHGETWRDSGWHLRWHARVDRVCSLARDDSQHHRGRLHNSIASALELPSASGLDLFGVQVRENTLLPQGCRIEGFDAVQQLGPSANVGPESVHRPDQYRGLLKTQDTPRPKG
jgi:hypothetical protein